MLPARVRKERQVRKALDENAPQRIACHFGTRIRPEPSSKSLARTSKALGFIDEVKRRSS
jgi:hypothetical protein